MTIKLKSLIETAKPDLKHQKTWKEMTGAERKKAYQTALKSGQTKDTFRGFSKMMHRSLFNVKTGEPIEVA